MPSLECMTVMRFPTPWRRSPLVPHECLEQRVRRAVGEDPEHVRERDEEQRHERREVLQPARSRGIQPEPRTR